MLSAGEQVVHIHSSVLGILPGMLCQDISCAQLQLRCFRLAFCFPQNSGVNPKALSVLRVPGTSMISFVKRGDGVPLAPRFGRSCFHSITVK